MQLSEVHSELVDLVREKIGEVAAWPEIKYQSEPLERLSSLFQGLAICHVLRNADVDEFSKNLARSGHARRYFLTKCRLDSVNDDRRNSASRTEAVFDALAGGQRQLACDIADLSSTQQWNPAWEYEDDFCYYNICHAVILDPANTELADVSHLLEQFERSLEGTDSTKLRLCKALVAREADEFEESLFELLQAAVDKADIRRSSMVEPDIATYLYWPRSFINVEALGLLSLAELRGIKTDTQHSMCPEIAQFAKPASEPDMFQGMDRARR